MYIVCACFPSYQSSSSTDNVIDHSIILQAYISRKNQGDKVIVFERSTCLFIFNFHPSQSFVDYKIGVQEAGKYPFKKSSPWELAITRFKVADFFVPP